MANKPRYSVFSIRGSTFSSNTASSNSDDGFGVNTFSGGNTAVFSNNSATNNIGLGYSALSGDGTNLGFCNGSGTDSF